MNENEIKSLRQKIRKGHSDDQLLSIKPFAAGMYGFVMVLISYYSRVREQLKIDYDSFMIIQTVVSHSLYQHNKKKDESRSYFELEMEWEKILTSKNEITPVIDNYSSFHLDREEARGKNNLKLYILKLSILLSIPALSQFFTNLDTSFVV